MDRRAATQTVGHNVRAAIDAAGLSASSVASATDKRVIDIAERLESGAPVTISELSLVGGFLRIPVANLLEGAGA